MEKTKAGATSLNRLSSQGKARRESQKKAAASSFSAHSAVIRPRLPARVCSQTSQHWKFNQLARYSSLRGEYWSKRVAARDSTFLCTRHNSHWTHSPKRGRETKWRSFWCYFWDFLRAKKIEHFLNFKVFFAKVFRIASRFVLVICLTKGLCWLKELTWIRWTSVALS